MVGQLFHSTAHRSAEQFIDLRRLDLALGDAVGLRCGFEFGDVEGARPQKSRWAVGFLVHATPLDVGRDGGFGDGGRYFAVVP